MYESVKRGMVLMPGIPMPPDQMNPKSFLEITERNKGKAVMDENGVVWYEKKGTSGRVAVPIPG